MIDFDKLIVHTMIGAAVGGLFGACYGAYTNFIKVRICPTCRFRFMGIRGKPTLGHAMGAGFVCPKCSAALDGSGNPRTL